MAGRLRGDYLSNLYSITLGDLADKTIGSSMSRSWIARNCARWTGLLRIIIKKL